MVAIGIKKIIEEAAKMTEWPLEKILTISAIEYCTTVGKSLEDYELKGVVYSRRDDADKDTGIVKNIKVPEGTEVIVGIKFTPGTWAYGTALIPKEIGKDLGGSKKPTLEGID